MRTSEPITSAQIKIIHVAKAKLGLDEEDYRNLLAAFHVKTSKDMNTRQAYKFIEKLESLGFKKLPTQDDKKKPAYPTTKYQDRNKTFDKNSTDKKRYNRYGELIISKAQISLLYAIWINQPGVKNKTMDALNSFCKRITGKDRIEWCLSSDTNKIKLGIEKL